MEPTPLAKNWNDARDLLRKWREGNERKSADVIDLWTTLVGAHSSKLGDEKWMILEQVFIAALDIHNYDIADDVMYELKTRFPHSERVRYLQVLRLQAREKFDEALKLLDAMIGKDNTNSQAYKRRIAILKSQGKTSEAIKELTEYLEKFMSDQEAWSELCDLYLSEAEYTRAVFCAEELILHNPHCYFVHQRVADIRYTMGGIENLKMAVSHYSHALKLNADSMRALFGLLLASSSLATNQRVPAQEKKDYGQLMSWAAKEVSNRYEMKTTDGGKEQIKALEGVLSELKIQ